MDLSDFIQSVFTDCCFSVFDTRIESCLFTSRQPDLLTNSDTGNVVVTLTLLVRVIAPGASVTFPEFFGVDFAIFRADSFGILVMIDTKTKSLNEFQLDKVHSFAQLLIDVGDGSTIKQSKRHD
jgi:hypothetical protein